MTKANRVTAPDAELEASGASFLPADAVAVLDAAVGEELAEGAQLEQHDAAQLEQQEAAQLQTAEQSWREALDMGKAVLIGFFPRLEAVWTPDALDREAAALARCWPDGSGDLLSNKWLGLAIATAPLAIGTARVIGEDVKAAEQRRKLASSSSRSSEATPTPTPTPAPMASEYGGGMPAFGGVSA